jgi:pSer/pThr/pTyr-binding forkhead associated (FHA) protein
MSKPVKCARCGRENDVSFAFCLDCGQPLQPPTPPPSGAQVCTACGARIQAGFKFCGHCGSPVAPPPRGTANTVPAEDPAERRTLNHQGPPPGGPSRLATVRHDGLPGAVFLLDRDEAICGRTEGEIRLGEDPTVSPRHARFTRRDGALRVEDLGSENGTYLRLKGAHALAMNEEVRLGRQLLRLEAMPRPTAVEGEPRSWGSPDQAARVRLTQLLDGGGTGEVFPLRPGENGVGREVGDITFPGDRYVSARHARLEVSDGAVTLTDLGSSNGTFVKVVGAQELAAGDQLLIGTQLLRVEA